LRGGDEFRPSMAQAYVRAGPGSRPAAADVRDRKLTPAGVGGLQIDWSEKIRKKIEGHLNSNRSPKARDSSAACSSSLQDAFSRDGLEVGSLRKAEGLKDRNIGRYLMSLVEYCGVTGLAGGEVDTLIQVRDEDDLRGSSAHVSCECAVRDAGSGPYRANGTLTLELQIGGNGRCTVRAGAVALSFAAA
jgi:hypothetical protein